MKPVQVYDGDGVEPIDSPRPDLSGPCRICDPGDLTMLSWCGLNRHGKIPRVACAREVKPFPHPDAWYQYARKNLSAALIARTQIIPVPPRRQKAQRCLIYDRGPGNLKWCGLVNGEVCWRKRRELVDPFPSVAAWHAYCASAHFARSVVIKMVR